MADRREFVCLWLCHDIWMSRALRIFRISIRIIASELGESQKSKSICRSFCRFYRWAWPGESQQASQADSFLDYFWPAEFASDVNSLVRMSSGRELLRRPLCKVQKSRISRALKAAITKIGSIRSELGGNFPLSSSSSIASVFSSPSAAFSSWCCRHESSRRRRDTNRMISVGKRAKRARGMN